MKQITIILLLIISQLSAYADNPDRYRLGGDAKLNAYRFDNRDYLILQFEDGGDCRLTQTPEMLIKLTDGEALRFSGEDANQGHDGFAINWGIGIVTGSESNVHYAIFYISEGQIEKLYKGIDKIAINTIPHVFEKEWKVDKIGKALYSDYMSFRYMDTKWYHNP